jgi:tRNA threonylcarbamoyladenosine biosynthesis protein TsaB
MTTLLAFDTATEHMSLAVAVADRVLTHEAAGGALASATLIPAILALLAQAGVRLAELDAIAFGRGPGAFTGLRTACAVAQGLAYGAGKPVLPIDTLLAIAEDSRNGNGNDDDNDWRVWAVMDARMNEIYAAQYQHSGGRWQVLDAPLLITAEALNERWAKAPPQGVAGNALTVFGAQLRPGDAALLRPAARPTARAMLPLALAAWHAGGALDAALALPLYLRDKVAQTTVEREAARLAKLEALG